MATIQVPDSVIGLLHDLQNTVNLRIDQIIAQIQEDQASAQDTGHPDHPDHPHGA